MIVEAKSMQPFIEFSGGFTQVTPVKGIPVTVWLNTLFNDDTYTFQLVSAGTVQKISNFQYMIAIQQQGEYIVYMNVISKDKVTVLKSNELKIIIE